MWRRIPFGPMLFGAFAMVALIFVLAIRDWRIYLAGAAIGAAYFSLVAGLMLGRPKETNDSQLDLARDLQQRLLPPPTLETRGYRVAARNIPAPYVAGDFYDFVPLPGGGLLIVIADVSATGMAAGLIMASVKAMIPLIVGEERHAGALLGRLNERLVGQLPQREFIALALGIFDPTSGAVSLANAALPDPLLMLPSGAVRPIVVAGPRYPIGVRKNLSYESVTVKLSPGDRILFFTDGVAEAMVEGEPLGYERLTTEVRQAGSVEELMTRLEQMGATHEDDWTAVMLEIFQPQASGTISSAAAVRLDNDVM